jgi:hypothetical protein
MGDNGEGQEKRKGGKGKLLAFLALLAGVVAFMMFWRRRRASDEDEDEDEE